MTLQWCLGDSRHWASKILPCQAPDKHPSNSQTVLFCSGQPYIEAVEAVEDEKLGKHWGQCIERVYCFLSLCPCFGFDHSRTVAAVVVNLVVLAAYLTASTILFPVVFVIFLFAMMVVAGFSCSLVFLVVFLFGLFVLVIFLLFLSFALFFFFFFSLFFLLSLLFMPSLFFCFFLLCLFVWFSLLYNCILLSIIIIIVSILVLLVVAAISQIAIHPFHASSCCSAYCRCCPTTCTSTDKLGGGMATYGNTALSNTALSNTALSNILFTFFRCFGNDNELSEHGNVNTFLRKQSKQYQPISHLFTQSFALSCMPVAWLWSAGPDCGRWAIASWDRMPSRTSWKSAWRGVAVMVVQHWHFAPLKMHGF